MKHSLATKSNNVAFQSASSTQSSLPRPVPPWLAAEQLSYTRGAALSRAPSFDVPAPAITAAHDVKQGNERLRFALVLLLSVGYIALTAYMLSLSTGRPSVGLTAQRDAGGVWRVQSVAPAGLSYDQGVQAGYIVEKALDGKGNPVDLAKLNAATSDFSFASRIAVKPAVAGASSVTIDTSNLRPNGSLQSWGYTLLSLIFFAVGSSVFVKARQRTAATVFYFFCLTTTLALAIAPAIYLRTAWLLPIMFVTASAWAGAFALFFLEFPVRVGKTRLRHRLFVSIVISGHLVLVLGYLWVLSGHLSDYESLRVLMGSFMGACIVVGLGVLLRSLIIERSLEVRQQLFLLLGGTAVAVAPFILLVALPATLIRRMLVSMELSVLALGVMPLAFAYAITQHQLLGITNFIRRSVVYVLMGFTVLVVFSVAAAALSALMPSGWWREDAGLLGFGLFVFLVALSFGYVQRHVERLVDRYIYHDAYDYKDALLQFSAQLAAEQDLYTLADQLVERTCRLMNLSCGVLLLAVQPGPEDIADTDRPIRTQPAPTHTDARRGEGEGEAAYTGSMLNNLSLNRHGLVETAYAHGQDGAKDGGIYLEPYAMYGGLAGSLLEGLRAELSNLGIVLRQPDTSAQIIHIGGGRGTDRGVQFANEANDFRMAPHIASSGIAPAPQPDAGSANVRSYLGVPLWTRSYFVGVLCLGGKKSGERFTRDDISLINTLGSQAALAIYNAQLYEAREQALLDTITALAHAIEAKDTYTIHHCEKITARAVALAQAMSLPRQEVENIRLGSILHDVGKIGIPDAVLNKPSKLTDEEYEIIKQHAQIGARIVQSVGALQGVVPIVRHHQERYDGKGYPDGLAGSEIPVGARIISVVDAYGAMTEDRVYRKALGHERAVAELMRYAGTQFDPQVVDTFICILKDQPELAEVDTEESCALVSP